VDEERGNRSTTHCLNSTRKSLSTFPSLASLSPRCRNVSDLAGTSALTIFYCSALQENAQTSRLRSRHIRRRSLSRRSSQTSQIDKDAVLLFNSKIPSQINLCASRSFSLPSSSSTSSTFPTSVSRYHNQTAFSSGQETFESSFESDRIETFASSSSRFFNSISSTTLFESTENDG